MNKFEIQMVEKLRYCLADVITPEFTDFDLLRWLNDHDYDFDTVIPGLRHHFRFMKSYDFSVCPKQEYYSIMEKYWGFGLLGLTGKDNNFVFIDTLGTLDSDGVIKSVQRSACIFHRIYKFEQVLKAIRNREKETGRQSGIVFLTDFEGAQITTSNILNFKIFMSLINVLNVHCKDIVQKCIVVNTPPFIHILWNVACKVLPERMRKRILIIGPNWRTNIFQYFDADALPIHWGGNLVDENNDPMYRTKVVVTSKVPSHLYWHPSKEDPSPTELTSLTIHAGSFKFLTYKVRELGKCLEFWYYTDKDWGFGIFYTEDPDENDPDEMEMVYPQMVHIPGPAIIIENGKIVCKKRGIYKLWFNNAFSWVTKLKIKYKVEIRDL